MPFVLRPYNVRAKDPYTGYYLSQNVIADQATDEKLAAIDDAGDSALSDISVAAQQAMSDLIEYDAKMYDDLIKYGAMEIGSKFFRTTPSFTLRGVTWTRKGDNTWHAEGTATGGISFIYLYRGDDATYVSEKPDEIVPGNICWIIVERTDPNLQVYFSRYKDNSVSQPTAEYFDDGAYPVEIPANCTGIQIRANVASGLTVNGDIKITLLSAPPPSALWRKE